MLDTINILVLEDSKVDYMMTKRTILKNAPNAAITQATNREDFEQRISWMEYDLILADYNLPAYNGLEALLYARQHYSAIPFIFLSGTLSDEGKVAQAILQGANGYETKENIHQLWNQVETVLEKTRLKTEELRKLDASRRKRKLQLQKAIGILEQAEKFANKQEVLNILTSINESENNYEKSVLGNSVHES